MLQSNLLKHPVSPGIELREYQDRVIQHLRVLVKAGYKSILLQAPTGSGKTVIAAAIVRRALERDSRVLFLAHRRELIKQTASKLRDFGLLYDTAMLMAGEEMDGSAPIQVASIDTLRARAMTRSVIPFPQAQLVIVDECHRSLAATYSKVIAHYLEQGAVVLGLTATPIRGDGRGLGTLYQQMVCCPDVAALTREGYLVPVRYFAPSIPDLTGVRTIGGDYNQLDLEKAMDKKILVGDIVDHWLRLGEQRPTVVFAAGVGHSLHLREEFEARGISCGHVDADTPSHERDEIIRDVASGRIKVLTNCMIFVEGFDMPTLSCCVLARPTKSLLLYLQMAGRVLRPAPGKSDTIMIDHSGACYRHGPIDEERDWSLDPDTKIQDRESKKKKNVREAKPVTCPRCSCIYYSAPKCPECGWVPERKAQRLDVVDGDLVEVNAGQTIDKKTFYRELMGIGEERGYKPGWAAYAYRAKFGRYPVRRWSDEIPSDPSQTTRNWAKYLAIRRARSAA